VSDIELQLQKAEAALRKVEEWHNEVVRERNAARELLDWSWGVICNVSNGDWSTQTPEWRAAAGTLGEEIHKPSGTSRPVDRPPTTS